jgi:arsenite oxidase large subunit
MMVDVGRRQFLSGASMAAAGVAAATVAVPQSKAAPPARLNYPSNRLANVSDLKANEPLNVSYPDNDAPGADKDCVVNSGLGSVRGARMAEMSYSRQRNTQLQRLTDPMVWRYGQMQPTSWDDALDLVARVTVGAITQQGGEDNLIVSAFDHGGAGGGYENTWGTGKLYFSAMKVKNIRIHNRPAYNSEVHATRDMGVGELNNCYEDAELADTIVAVGTNALETQTNYFLNHWIPNLHGTSVDKKKGEFGTEPVEPSRIIIVDPRRACPPGNK